jgi:aldehyde reductase
VGEGIATAIAEGAITRERLYVTSKLWNTDHAPEDVRPACEKTLRELGLEYLDQYLMHWPVAWRKQEDGSMFPHAPDGKGFDTVEIDFVDTWRAMEELVDAGLVKSIGVSNFSIEELQRLLAHCRIRPVVNQVECHPYFNQHELREYLTAQNIRLVAYCPLGNINPGKVRKEILLLSEIWEQRSHRALSHRCRK